MTKKPAKDLEGNLVGCPSCKSDDLKKDGFQYWKNNRKRQRWQCKSCGFKTLNPIILEKNEFSIGELPIDEMNIDEPLKIYNNYVNFPKIDSFTRNIFNQSKYIFKGKSTSIKLKSNKPLNIEIEEFFKSKKNLTDIDFAKNIISN